MAKKSPNAFCPGTNNQKESKMQYRVNFRGFVAWCAALTIGVVSFTMYWLATQGKPIQDMKFGLWLVIAIIVVSGLAISVNREDNNE